MHSLMKAQSPFPIKTVFLFLLFLLHNSGYSAPISQNPWFQFSRLYQQESQQFFYQKKGRQFSLKLSYFQKKGDTTQLKQGTENSATLIFGAPTFQLSELNQGSDNNPLLSLQFTPEVALKSNGLLFEAFYQKMLRKKLSIFLVAKTVFYNHHLKVTYPKNSFNLEVTTLSDLFIFKSVDSQTQFAFQLDALNRLPLINTGSGADFPFVSFFDETFSQPGVSMRGLLVTDAPLANTPIVIEKTNATTPPEPFVYAQLSPQQAPALSLTGDNIQEGDIRRFATNTDYRDFAATNDLSSFWVIPTETGGVIATNADKIQQAVQNLIADYDQSTTAILAEDDISLGEKNNTGFGGLWLQPGIAYHISEHVAQQWYMILVLPAEKKVGQNSMFRIPLGNNGHTAVGVGATTMFDFSFPLQIYLDYQYFYTAKKTEKIAIPKTNSSLLIGPVINATRSWHTVFLDSAVTTYVGKKNRLFFTAHYLLYHTSAEHMTLKFVDQSQYDMRKKTRYSDQTTHTLSFDVCVTYNTEQFLMSVSATAIKTIRAYQSVSENGWSIACNINF